MTEKWSKRKNSGGKKGEEAVNYSGRKWRERRRSRRKRKNRKSSRRRNLQGTLRGIPLLISLALHLRHPGSYVTFLFL